MGEMGSSLQIASVFSDTETGGTVDVHLQFSSETVETSSYIGSEYSEVSDSWASGIPDLSDLGREHSS